MKFQLQLLYPFSLHLRLLEKLLGSLGKRLWDNKQAGRYTYNLIPTANTKVLFPVDHDIGISYCRLGLHNYMLKYNCYRSGISQLLYVTVILIRETSEHFLFHCYIHKRPEKSSLNKYLRLLPVIKLIDLQLFR